MEQETEKKAFKKRLIVGAVIYALLFLLILTIANIEQINLWLGRVLRLLRPVIIGLALSYVCNPFMRFFENKIFRFLHKHSLRRALSMICAFLTVLLIILAILLLIIPQLVENLQAFITNYKTHVDSVLHQANDFIGWINRTAKNLIGAEALLKPLDKELFYEAFSNWFLGVEFTAEALKDFLFQENISNITDAIGETVSGIADAFLGLFISIYLLASKEKRHAQIMKLRNAMFNDKLNGRITRLCQTADRSFGRFLEGKLIDSLIVGLLVYLSFLIFEIPYAILLASIIAIANIIPVIGPYIGAIPSLAIILLADSSKAIPLLIIVVVIQLIDGNVIAPKILGTNTGISSLCVLISFTIMSSIWGLLGMILAVPVFATILDMADLLIEDSLQKKGLPSGVESYYPSSSAVNPIKDMFAQGNTGIERLKRRTLAVRKKVELNGASSLTKGDRFTLRLYSLALRLHITSETADRTYSHVAAEEIAKNAQAKSDRMMEEQTSKAVSDAPSIAKERS